MCVAPSPGRAGTERPIGTIGARREAEVKVTLRRAVTDDARPARMSRRGSAPASAHH